MCQVRTATFHDSTFDCVCMSWSTGIISVPFGEALALALQALKQGKFPESAGADTD